MQVDFMRTEAIAPVATEAMASVATEATASVATEARSCYNTIVIIIVCDKHTKIMIIVIL